MYSLVKLKSNGDVILQWLDVYHSIMAKWKFKFLLRRTPGPPKFIAKNTQKSIFGGTFYLNHIPRYLYGLEQCCRFTCSGVRLINIGLISILILADNNNIFRLMLFWNAISVVVFLFVKKLPAVVGETFVALSLCGDDWWSIVVVRKKLHWPGLFATFDGDHFPCSEMSAPSRDLRDFEYWSTPRWLWA
jgi:hypothetical protein